MNLKNRVNEYGKTPFWLGEQSGEVGDVVEQVFRKGGGLLCLLLEGRFGKGGCASLGRLESLLQLFDVHSAGKVDEERFLLLLSFLTLPARLLLLKFPHVFFVCCCAKVDSSRFLILLISFI